MNAKRSFFCFIIFVFCVAAGAEELVPRKKILLDQNVEILSKVVIGSVDKEGNIYIADSKPKRILKYDKSGRFIKIMASHGDGPGEIRFIINIAIDENNSRLIVMDSEKNSLILIGKDGNFIKQITLSVFSHSVFVNKYGEVFIIKMPVENKPIFAKLNNEFKETAQFFNFSGKGKFNNFSIYHFIIDGDSNGNVYAAEGLIYKINVFDRYGKFIRSFGLPGEDFRPFTKNPPQNMSGPKYKEWKESFEGLFHLYILQDKYCVVFYKTMMNPTALLYYDIYSLEGKKLGHGSLPAGVRPLAGKDSNGNLYCSEEEISADGMDVKFRLIEYSVR